MNMNNPLPFPMADDAAFGGGLNYVSELFAIQMRNMEAIRLAQQKMLEGMGVLAKHQAEMLEETLRRSFGAQPSALASGSDIRGAIAGQIESLKTAIKESQSNSNVLSELAARSSGDVANTLQSRMMAALDEFKAALEHAMPERLTFASAAAPPAVMVQPASQS
jgi:phasin family protein